MELKLFKIKQFSKLIHFVNKYDKMLKNTIVFPLPEELSMFIFVLNVPEKGTPASKYWLTLRTGLINPSTTSLTFL